MPFVGTVFDGFLLALSEKLPLWEESIAGNVNSMTYNLVHTQVTLFGLVPLVIQFQDLTQNVLKCVCVFSYLSIVPS